MCSLAGSAGNKIDIKWKQEACALAPTPCLSESLLLGLFHLLVALGDLCFERSDPLGAHSVPVERQYALGTDTVGAFLSQVFPEELLEIEPDALVSLDALAVGAHREHSPDEAGQSRAKAFDQSVLDDHLATMPNDGDVVDSCDNDSHDHLIVLLACRRCLGRCFAGFISHFFDLLGLGMGCG